MVYYHQLSVMFVRVWRCFIRIVRWYLRYCILALSFLFCSGIFDSIVYIISVYIFSDGKLHCLMCVATASLSELNSFSALNPDWFIRMNWDSPWYPFDIADGTIVYDEYSTPARWSRVTLAYTFRIAWCCLFSYFISELRRDGLWACPQLSSYSWWCCEYNMYNCWQNYPFNLWEKSMYVSYTTDQPG